MLATADNIDTIDLVPAFGRGLGDGDGTIRRDIHRVQLKICGFLPFGRERPALEKAVDVSLEHDLDAVLIDLDLLSNELQIVPLQLLLGQDIVEDLHGGLRRPVDPDDGVPLVLGHGDLISQAVDPADQITLQLVIGLFQMASCSGCLTRSRIRWRLVTFSSS